MPDEKRSRTIERIGIGIGIMWLAFVLAAFAFAIVTDQPPRSLAALPMGAALFSFGLYAIIFRRQLVLQQREEYRRTPWRKHLAFRGEPSTAAYVVVGSILIMLGLGFLGSFLLYVMA